MPTILGLYAGVAAGKDFCALIFEEKGALVIDADAEVRVLLEHDSSVRSQIREYFGDEVFQNEKISRKALANRVFSNTEDRLALEAILHPLV